MSAVKKLLFAFLLLLLLATGGYFYFRVMLLETVIQKAKDKFKDRFRCELSVGATSFVGFARVSIEDIAIIPYQQDTLFKCDSTSVSFSFSRFLKNQPPVDHVVLNGGFIFLSEKDSADNNYNFLFTSGNSKKDQMRSDQRKPGPGRMLRSLWNRFLALADFNVAIRNFNISWKTKSYYERLALEEFKLLDTRMVVKATDSLEQKSIHWIAEGTIDPAGYIEADCKSMPFGVHAVPFIQKLTGISCSMQSASIRMEVSPDVDDGFEISASVIAPSINHWRIAPEPVSLDSASAQLTLITADSSILFDKGSRMQVNRLNIDFESAITISNSKAIVIHADIPETPSDIFFGSLPNGLFGSLKGIETSGYFSYEFDLDVNTANPDSVKFESDLDARKFGIHRFGEENLSMMSRSFTYVARENDRVMKVFQVGPENPSFTPLNMIQPLLVSCVLTAEDGTFFHHRGFNEEAFRKSIATNIREKRFARGGSTISMQLVKNVHLNRNKTISRKLEEALLVWIIENYGLCSKERMMEVYLNIIEWGPGIYGIHDAAQFYFAKDPMSLTLEECIFLSSIIPNPKAYKYSFDKEGNLRSYLQGYFRLVAGRLAGKEIITQTQKDSLKYNVTLAGPARERVVPADTVAADSTFNFEELLP